MIKPTYYYDSITQIDPKKLIEHGYKTVLCDLDNTLVSFTKRNVDELALKFLESLRDNGIEIYIISNNRKKRVVNFANPISIEFLFRAKKPKLKKVLKYTNEKNIDLEHAIFIGDQTYTDIKLAKRLEIDSILVYPRSESSVFIIRMNKRINRRLKERLIKNNEFKQL